MSTTDDLARYRALFPVCRKHVYLNNASVAPPSVRVRDAAIAWLDDAVDNAVVNERAWEERSEATRRAAGALVGAGPDAITFVRSTSHGLGMLAEGIAWEPGDEVCVATSIEYPSNVYPWQHLASRGVVVREIEPVRGGVTAERVRDVMSPRTRLVSVSSVQYATGHATDLEAIGALCAERNAFFAVDAIQSLGAFPLDVGRARIDFLTADSHKWLLGINGIGLAYVGPQLLPALRPVLVGWKSTVGAWNFDRASFDLRSDAAKLEEGSPSYVGLYALGAALDLLHEVGVPRIATRIRELVTQLADGLEALGCDVTPGPEDRAGIVTFVPPRGEARALFERMASASVRVSLRRGRIRVSPHFYNDASDVDAVIAHTREHLQSA